MSARRSLARLIDENSSTPKHGALKLKTPNKTFLNTKINFENATFDISTNTVMKSASKEVINVLNSSTCQEQESDDEMSQMYLLRDIDETESDMEITKYSNELLNISKIHSDNCRNENKSLGLKDVNNILLTHRVIKSLAGNLHDRIYLHFHKPR